MSGRGKSPTQRGTKPARARTSSPDFSDDIPTTHYDPPGASPGQNPASSNEVSAASSNKIVAISMKTPADPKLAPVKVQEKDMPHSKLRALSEVSRAQIPLNLGNLAPPYDPNEARKRTMKEYIVWGCISVMLACAIALAVWFLAT
jgi:hypothetical protein